MKKFQIVSVVLAFGLANANIDSNKVDGSRMWHLSASSKTNIDSSSKSYKLKKINIYGGWISLLPLDYSQQKRKKYTLKKSEPSNLTKTIKGIFASTSKLVNLSQSTTLSPKKIVAISKVQHYGSIMPKRFESYEQFKRFVNLRKSYKIYQDKTLLAKAKPKDIKVIIDVSEQRARVLVAGKVALDTPCTTGSKHKFEPNTKTYRDKHTPLGVFKIKEKIANKRSTIFVNIYRKGRLIYHGDKRKYRGSLRGVKIVGAPLYNWMRLTSSGIGLHASSHVKRYPGSNGCIRLPMKIADTIFNKVARGTIVKVVQ